MRAQRFELEERASAPVAWLDRLVGRPRRASAKADVTGALYVEAAGVRGEGPAGEAGPSIDWDELAALHVGHFEDVDGQRYLTVVFRSRRRDGGVEELGLRTPLSAAYQPDPSLPELVTTLPVLPWSRFHAFWRALEAVGQREQARLPRRPFIGAHERAEEGARGSALRGDWRPGTAPRALDAVIERHHVTRFGDRSPLKRGALVASAALAALLLVTDSWRADAQTRLSWLVFWVLASTWPLGLLMWTRLAWVRRRLWARRAAALEGRVHACLPTPGGYQVLVEVPVGDRVRWASGTVSYVPTASVGFEALEPDDAPSGRQPPEPPRVAGARVTRAWVLSARGDALVAPELLLVDPEVRQLDPDEAAAAETRREQRPRGEDVSLDPGWRRAARYLFWASVPLVGMALLGVPMMIWDAAFGFDRARLVELRREHPGREDFTSVCEPACVRRHGDDAEQAVYCAGVCEVFWEQGRLPSRSEVEMRASGPR